MLQSRSDATPQISAQNQEFLSRVRALLDGLADRESNGKPPDAMLVTAPANIRYLSGFTGSSGWLLVSEQGTILFTDPRYTIQASEQTPFDVRIAEGPLTAALHSYAARKKCKRLGFERNRIGFETFEALREALPSGCELAPVNHPVEDLRIVKSANEIARIRASVETNSRAFRRACKSLRPGMREAEFAAEIDYQQRRAGGESSAFETIVAWGVRSALPHARPTSQKIEKGILLIDMGTFENGYASDMTRTLHIGKAPRRFRTLYQAVLDAQLAAIDAVRPGATASRIDKAARKVLDKAGFAKEFVHSTGHGLGLEIHEAPRIGKKSETVVQPGFAITIEPGAYFDGYGGVRIEDTVVVTETGCEVLTPTPKELVEW